MDPSILETATTPFEGSTTPPPLPNHPPALNRMVSVGAAPQDKGQTFNIVKVYEDLLKNDPNLTMPIAAIEALIQFLAQSTASTVFESLNSIESESAKLKAQIPNSISLSAGTDLFQRYLTSTIKISTSGSFDVVRQHLVSNGRLYVSRAKAARKRIAAYGSPFVRDGSVVLTHGGSRVIGALLGRAAETSRSGGNVRFKVIYVMNNARISESKAVVAQLREKGVPVATISEGAVGYAMGKVDLVIMGAEGVVENGGIISRMGTYQIALLAKAAGKPFYVAAESHKFVRLYPLGQYDLGIDQKVIDFKTEEAEQVKDEQEPETETEPPKPAEEQQEYFNVDTPQPKPKTVVADAVDYTPPALITALFTESGVRTPSEVSEELISMWYY